MFRFGLCVFLMGACAAAANGEPLTISSTTAWAEPIGSDVVLNDCFVNTDGADWLSSAFVCELTAGELYRSPGSLPHPNLPVEPFPPLDIDTWLAENVTVLGNADYIAANVFGMMDPTNLAASWTLIASLPTDPVPSWNGLAARIAFTPDAQGAWGFSVSAKGSDPVYISGVVQDGFMVIPEPGSFALLAGLLSVAFWRRK